MFIIRTAFWLSLIILVLPTDPQQQAKIYHTASNAVGEAATFCDRNQAVCTQGSAYWSTFRQKMEFGAKMVADIASERLFGKSPTQNQHAAASGSTAAPVSNTLAPGDLAPAWRSRTGA